MVIALAEQSDRSWGVYKKTLRLAALARAARSGQADAWPDNETLLQQVSQIRDGAADLLKQVVMAGTRPRRRSKRRRPRIRNPRLGEPMGKQMRQKSLKRRGRG